MLFAGIDFIEWIQQIRTPLLDQFFMFYAWFDTGDFYRLLILITWYAIGWKVGLRLLVLMTASEVTNSLSKQIFHLPRPCQVKPSLGLKCHSTYGFPSGAAQSSVLIPAFFIDYSRKVWVAVGMILFGFLLSFSRLYLGVHFLGDLIGGWFVGALLFVLYHTFYDSVEEWMKGQSSLVTFFIAVGVPLLLIPLLATHRSLGSFFLLIGVGIGVHINSFLNLHPADPKGFLQRTFRIVICVIASEIFKVLFYSSMIHDDTLRATLSPLLLGIAVTTLMSSFFKLVRY